LAISLFEPIAFEPLQLPASGRRSNTTQPLASG
jgi:hypothetical protein